MLDDFKKELEENLFILIKEFEEKWGVMISDIELDHFRTLEDRSKLNEFKMEVKL